MNDKPFQERISHVDKGALRRVLGVGDLFAVGYGDLGSSIYYALGITALYALGATPIALAIAGFVFACTALTYAEMTSMIRQGGGSASYSRHAFNDFISFIAGWALLLDYIVTIAISAYSIAPYLSFFFPILREIPFKIAITICFIFFLFLLNFFGTKHSTRLSWVLTMLTVCTQLIIIIIGAVWLVKVPEIFQKMRIGIHHPGWSPSWPDFWKGTAMAMVAYTGIESMAQLTSEAKRPAKTVPRAILYAMVTLLVVYLGISTVALSAVDPKTLGTTYVEDPVAGIVTALPFGGRILGGWIGILAAIILLVAANAGLMGSSRLSFNMGEYYQLPRFLYKLQPRFKTPVISLSIFTVLAVLIVIWSRGKLAFLADLYNFGAMLAFCATHISLLMLRWRKPNEVRPFKISCNITIRGKQLPITALIGAIATFCTWVLVVVTKPDGRYLGFAWIAIGLVMYFSYRKKQKIKPYGKLHIEKIKMPEYKPMSYKRILVPTRGGDQIQTIQMACQLAKIHGASVTALHVIEVPFSLSLNTPMAHRTAIGEMILQRAEALGREFHIGMELKLVQSRSVEAAILEMIEEGNYDLVVVGATKQPQKTYGQTLEKILKKSPCSVWIYYAEQAYIRSKIAPLPEEPKTQNL